MHNWGEKKDRLAAHLTLKSLKPLEMRFHSYYYVDNLSRSSSSSKEGNLQTKWQAIKSKKKKRRPTNVRPKEPNKKKKGKERKIPKQSECKLQINFYKKFPHRKEQRTEKRL